MVEIVESWDDFRAATDRCRYGIYQERDTVDGKEVRVLAGRFGYIGIFGDKEGEMLQKIINYCKSEGFIKIRGSVPDYIFFTAPTVG